VLQNKRFDRIGTRFVAPLVLGRPPSAVETHLTPHFIVEGRQVTMDVFNLTTILADRLGKPIASLTDEDARAKLIRAIDEFISQA
jgi:toxin CcdB